MQEKQNEEGDRNNNYLRRVRREKRMICAYLSTYGVAKNTNITSRDQIQRSVKITHSFFSGNGYIFYVNNCEFFVLL